MQSVLSIVEAAALIRFPMDDLVGSATDLAMTIRHPVYDCLYLVLAMTTGAPLATMDRRLRQAAQRLPAGVRPVRVWSGLA